MIWKSWVLLIFSFFFSSSFFSLEFYISLGGRANMILLLLDV